MPVRRRIAEIRVRFLDDDGGYLVPTKKVRPTSAVKQTTKGERMMNSWFNVAIYGHNSVLQRLRHLSIRQW